MSILGRKEVLGGKAKFGIFGDGKEVPQIAMARAFQKGDYRSGYYRDQTFMLALGIAKVEDLFAQVYADFYNDPFSGGRQMNGHFATPFINKDGSWKNLNEQYNVSACISPTGGQMARGLGLALASKKYRSNPQLQDTNFSNQGNEVAFLTIGDASTSEGIFWETMNAAAVMQVPLAMSVWDDGYGISVPIDYQTVNKSISKALNGFQSELDDEGLDIYVIKGWDYPTLIQAYMTGIEKIRETHKPALFHVREVTQPQGHSTSGSHTRYKTKERLAWEDEYDGIKKMREWMIDSEIATTDQLDEIEKEAKKEVKDAKNRAWKAFIAPIKKNVKDVQAILKAAANASTHQTELNELVKELSGLYNPTLREVITIAKQALRLMQDENSKSQSDLEHWLKMTDREMDTLFHKHTYFEGEKSALNISANAPSYSDNSPLLSGFEILNTFFDDKLTNMPSFYAFGEDVGQIGDVNQGFAGMQEKHGEERVFDTGIREWSILGQGLGMSMRGLRPIAEIQYLDYLVYALPILTDDIATIHYRSNGQQIAPVIIRTRGHRLEGIWHTGSPMGMLIHALRGICLLVPRNMVQAAGMYNTMLQSNDSALIIECLNGYRLKEQMPDNLNEIRVPVGIPEVLNEGTDVTLVTYGSCVRVAQEGIKMLAEQGISVELIDIQSLLPFDINQSIVESLKKTNRIVFMDEDVPGGATSFMMQEVLEKQGGYFHLDSKPITITAAAHRAAYGDVGDYYSKPQADHVFEKIYTMMHEAEPDKFKQMYFMR
jgi:pyruvate/2-oxoglutarate/acetoin dehydrogenase E1 component/TPP-dependent pyruvate/acetoin dehydrogenase alpha subunit